MPYLPLGHMSEEASQLPDVSLLDETRGCLLGDSNPIFGTLILGIKTYT